MIVQTVDFYAFRAAFEGMNRANQFTPEGLRVLFDYLEQVSDDIGEPLELDVIALCCEYAESTIEDVIRDYNIEMVDCFDPVDRAHEVERYLSQNTVFVGFTDSDTVVYLQF